MGISWKEALRMGQMKKTRKKGFTVAELLIVVAIIAVLVSIAIPVFRGKLEKAREAVDIYNMRLAASAAIEMFYTDRDLLDDAGFVWWNEGSPERCNAAAAFSPGTGTFHSDRKTIKAYGKGTKTDGKTEYFIDGQAAYSPKEDYTNAVIMVSIYPDASVPFVAVYWKQQDGKAYIGGQYSSDIPNYYLRIDLS